MVTIQENVFVLSDTPTDGFKFDPTKKRKVYPLPKPIQACHNGKIVDVYNSPTGNTLLTIVSAYPLMDNSGTPILEMYGRNGEVWYLNTKTENIWRII